VGRPTRVKRNESGCSGLLVKSSSFPTYPILSISQASLLQGISRPSHLSLTAGVKRQEFSDCRWKVISGSVGKLSLHGLAKSLLLDRNSMKVDCDVEGTGEGS
jgi:hypothetical protein